MPNTHDNFWLRNLLSRKVCALPMKSKWIARLWLHAGVYLERGRRSCGGASYCSNRLAPRFYKKCFIWNTTMSNRVESVKSVANKSEILDEKQQQTRKSSTTIKKKTTKNENTNRRKYINIIYIFIIFFDICSYKQSPTVRVYNL